MYEEKNLYGLWSWSVIQESSITNVITSRLNEGLSSHNLISTLHDELSVIEPFIFLSSS